MAFYLWNEATGAFAADDSEGEHDGKTVRSTSGAAAFASFGEASDFGQNFGPQWIVVGEDDNNAH